MPVSSGSRYESAEPLRDERGRPYFGRIIPPSKSVEYIEYYTAQGDRMDVLASRFLGDPTRWWEIAEVNPEIDSFEALPLQTRLRIPRAGHRQD